MQILQEQVLEILATLLTIGLGVVGQKLILFLKQKGIVAKLETKREVADFVVKAVEQIYYAEKGPEKLETAKDKIVDILLDNGISISTNELNMLLEAAVKGMNDGIEKGKGE